MTLVATPSLTDGIVLLAAQTLTRGSRISAPLDLRTCLGAYVFVRIGRGGTNALTDGVSTLIRRIPNNNAAGWWHPQGYELPGGYLAASSTTVNVDSAAGSTTLNVASVSGFAAGDLICLEASDHSRLEFHRIAATATGILYLDSPLQFTHTSAQADTVRNKADAWPPQFLDGWSLWDVCLDYCNDSAGDSVTIQVFAQKLAGTTITG